MTTTELDAGSKVRFYHTPKAGGTTIFEMTQKWDNFKRAHPNENHVQIKDYPPASDETALTIVRHPYTRFESAFYHMVDACDDRFYYRRASVSDCESMRHYGINFAVFHNDPNQFLLALENATHPYHDEAVIVFDNFSIFRPQFYWLQSADGRNLHESLKVILRQENLRREFAAVARKLGHQMPIWHPDLNRRLTTQNVPLTETSKGILRKLYADDFKYFGFDP